MGLFLNQGFRDWDDARASFSPSDPVSSTGTGLSSLPSMERGLVVGVVLLSARPLTSGLRIKSAMT